MVVILTFFAHLVCAMREVHSCNVHPRLDHFLGSLHSTGGRSCIETDQLHHFKKRYGVLGTGVVIHRYIDIIFDIQHV